LREINIPQIPSSLFAFSACKSSAIKR
jgi:hypothetical protein